ncbi:MAG: TA system VapC family ribonuclease toxin [Caulobacteraceae bacterium]
MIFLLDVNVLIALLDPAHIHHEPAHRWFAREGAASWATCPLTENGALRIMGGSRYPKSPGTPAVVAPSLLSLRSLPGHQFWPDDISLLDSRLFDSSRLLRSDQITDSYLLALACTKGGKLATFDRRVVTTAVRSGQSGLHLVG